MPRSTCYRLRDGPEPAEEADPIDEAARGVREELQPLRRPQNKEGARQVQHRGQQAENPQVDKVGSLAELRSRLNEWVWWYNNERLHSKLGHMSPVEFRLAGHGL